MHASPLYSGLTVKIRKARGPAWERSGRRRRPTAAGERPWPPPATFPRWPASFPNLDRQPGVQGRGMHILVTGGAGFIGSSYVDLVLERHPEDRVTVLDALTYAGSERNLEHFQADPRLSFVHGDIADAALVDELVGQVDAVVNFAAETHVDRSLLDPEAFLRLSLIHISEPTRPY